MFIDGIQMGQHMSSETNNVIDAEAHCDGPCGVYDPASARIAGEAVQSMTNKMLTLAENHSNDCSSAAYINTMSRYAESRKKKRKNARMSYSFCGQISSSHSISNPSLICMTPSGRQPSCAALARLKSQPTMLRN